MDDSNSGDRDVVIDLEIGRNEISAQEQGERVLNQVQSEDLSSGNGEDLTMEENVGLLESRACAEKPKKKGCKKPPRPPRHPKASSLDVTDQKLVRELAELAAMKRARMERMKKRMKNAKLASSNSNNNLFALIITILFCLVVVWQGLFYHDSSSIRFHGSPEASARTTDGLISIQFYKNSTLAPDLPQSVSPNNVVPVPAFLG